MILAILGKPNVGKSTIFNRLCGKRLAIVDNQPGVTRDRKVFAANIAGNHFNLMDTAGWESADKLPLAKEMSSNSIIAASEADILLFMIEAHGGVGQEDKEFAAIIRATNKPVILLVNKCDLDHHLDLNSVYQLGLGEPVFIAAHTGMGFDELNSRIKSLGNAPAPARSETINSIKVCLVGRPNVGKSTIFNKLLKMERSLTSAIAGTTRDAISHFLDHQGHVIELIDTAGLRKRGSIDHHLEKMAAAESINAIRRSNIVILVVDATQPLEKQDLTIAHIAINEGKAVILVANKIDKYAQEWVKGMGILSMTRSEGTHKLNLTHFKQELGNLAGRKLHELKGLPVVPLAAISEKANVSSILSAAIAVEQRRCIQINTGPLNRWLQDATTSHIPPLGHSGRRIKIKYITQSSSKPPTFILFINTPEDLPESYLAYLTNSLRQKFDLGGVPIRLSCRKNNNPFIK